jgi:FAD/FMN-containing dehydrogenase
LCADLFNWNICDFYLPCSVFHSTASFACPYTSDLIPAAPDSSSAAPSYVAIMTEDFSKILKVDKQAYTVTVQAGLKVLDLLRYVCGLSAM